MSSARPHVPTGTTPETSDEMAGTEIEQCPVLSEPSALPRNGSTTLDVHAWQQRHRQVLQAATSDNTRRTYRSAVRHYQNWGGVLPSDSATLIRYLMAYADTLNPGTLSLRLTAIAQWHRSQGFPDPTASTNVRKTLLGLRRLNGKPKRKAKALQIDDLECIVRALNAQNDWRALRDNALIQLAFFGAFRRSEVVQIGVEGLSWEADGLVIMLPRSKTDQTGQGLRKAIPHGDPQYCCPPTALKRWLTAAGIQTGPVFRAITRWGALGEDALDPSAVNTILETRAGEVGLEYTPELSSHSFRRGMATSARRAGADFEDIKRQGGWRHDGTVQGYIEEAEQFTSNAAGQLLKRIRSTNLNQ